MTVLAAANRQVRVEVLMDATQPLRQIDAIQRKLDSLTIKNLKLKIGVEAFDNITKGANKATKQIETLGQALTQAKKDMEKMLYANRMDMTFTSSDSYKNKKKEIEDLTYQLNQQKKLFASFDQEKMQARQNKQNAAEIKQYQSQWKQVLDSRKAQEKEIENQRKAEEKRQREAEKQRAKEAKANLEAELAATKAINDYRQRGAQSYRQKQSNNEFTNYSRELAKLERQATQVYHKLQNPNIDTMQHEKLKKNLADITAQYAKLNRESVNFRKEIGVSNSRGFYDLNHSLDYFRAKVRSRLVYSFATEAENILTTIPSGIVNSLSNYQQNRVNFAQVMPDNVANNQQLMNDTMREFTQIAADYGTSVNDVVEAGRLWGRQYKDVAVVQELVRNSTKLSITDNMSLVSVNKGLEATMQQYNIHLKDAAEAQAYSGKIVDSWAKLADNAVVTAADLAAANERSAGAAYQAGVGFDYLQAMITTMSAATGKAGGEVGRSIRSMLVSMNTARARKQLEQLGVATTELDENGQRHVRSFEKIITDLMLKLKTSTKDVSNVILTMSGGKRTCPLL